jgi:fructose-bisphosphate aldolase class II
MEIIEDIHRRLPDTHIVMHGSSSVPADIVERVKAAGGEVDAGFGVPISAIRRGIEHGVRKVNIDTDGRLAITAFMREHYRDKPGDWDPRGPGKAARAGQKFICMQRMVELGMAGHAQDYTPMSLDEMAARYATGVGTPA